MKTTIKTLFLIVVLTISANSQSIFSQHISHSSVVSHQIYNREFTDFDIYMNGEEIDDRKQFVIKRPSILKLKEGIETAYDCYHLDFLAEEVKFPFDIKESKFEINVEFISDDDEVLTTLNLRSDRVRYSATNKGTVAFSIPLLNIPLSILDWTDDIKITTKHVNFFK